MTRTRQSPRSRSSTRLGLRTLHVEKSGKARCSPHKKLTPVAALDRTARNNRRQIPTSYPAKACSCSRTDLWSSVSPFRSNPMTQYKKKRHAYYFTGAVKLSESERKKYVNEIFAYFEKHPKKRMRYVGTGDTMVFGFRHDDEIIVYDTMIRTEYVRFRKEKTK